MVSFFLERRGERKFVYDFCKEDQGLNPSTEYSNDTLTGHFFESLFISPEEDEVLSEGMSSSLNGVGHFF